LAEDEVEAARRFPDPESLPDPDRLASMADAEALAASAEQRFAALHQHPAFESLRRLPPAERAGLRSRMAWLANEAAALQGRRESWVREALADVRERRGGPWQARLQQLDDLIVVAQPLVAKLGAVSEVRVSGGDVDALVPLAQALQAHLESGGRVKVGPGGDPRPGAFAPRPVKQAASLFERARVDGLPPTRPSRAAPDPEGMGLVVGLVVGAPAGGM
jgi:hypothetical protein